MGEDPTSTVWSLSLVPVQSWIGAARRSRDLLAGSAILYWLTARLLDEIGRNGGDVELPRPPTTLLESNRDLRAALSANGYGIPNRASGRIPLDLDRAESLFRSFDAERLPAAWRELISEVGRSTARSHPRLWRLVRDEIEATSCPFQLIWCLQDAASADLESIDRLFAAVKRSRSIAAHRGAPVPKCGQCGLREAVGGNALGGWRAFQDRLAAEASVRAGQRIMLDERLCALCLVKRFVGYLPAAPFPSTSEIAARPWRAAVAAVDALVDPLRAFDDAARSVPTFEGATSDITPLVFLRSLEREQRAAEAAADEERQKSLERVAAARERLRAAIVAWNQTSDGTSLATEPSNYLAVLAFDGDRMAERVRCDPDLAPKVAAFQEQLAKRLSSSVERGSVADRLEHAQAFYLGGDEGLLLAPVEELLATAFSIRELWRASFAESELAGAPTLSMGIAVFDRERALGSALHASHNALAAAKAAGRDRLAVSLVTASGIGSATIAPWHDWTRAVEAESLLLSGRLSRGWPHDLGLFLRGLPPAVWTNPEARSAIRSEVRRLTVRRTPRREDAELVWSRLAGDSWWVEQPSRDVIASVGDQLHLVAFLAREGGVAVGAEAPGDVHATDAPRVDAAQTHETRSIA